MTREDVISWLEYLSDDARSKADSLVPTNIEIACGMAIEALKAQEPRVLALDEIHGSMAVWLEDVDKADVILAITESEFYALHGLCRCFITSDNRRIAPLKREYGIRWRAWTSEPTDEQREAVKWEWLNTNR